MLTDLAPTSLSFDIGTLFLIAICVAALLGVFLMFAWMQERTLALAWWGLAYLIGGASGALWRFGHLILPAVPANLATILLFVAVGMIWSGARQFHGLPVHWVAMLFGAAFWLSLFCPGFRSIGGVAHRRCADHRGYVHVPHRRGTSAGAAQIAHPALACNILFQCCTGRSSCFP